MKQRLSRFLAKAGISSRRKSEEIIMSGNVRVNGSVERLPQRLVSDDIDEIKVFGKKLILEKRAYYMFNKPVGYVCSSKQFGKKLALDFFADIPLRLFTVGRLDEDTSGLLLVTNDGDFTEKILHPSSNISKEYVMKTDKYVSHEHLVKMSRGVYIDNKLIKPLRVSKVRRGTVKVVIHEGKKRQIRIMAQVAGFGSIMLKRVRIGSLHLGNLKKGSFRELTRTEIESVFGK